MYDPSGPGRLVFAFFAAMADTERENIRELTLEGLDAAARKGKRGGRPPVITEDMLHTVLRRRASGESVEQIQPDLIILRLRRRPRPCAPTSFCCDACSPRAPPASNGPACDVRTVIRRPQRILTPKECERVQDMPLLNLRGALIMGITERGNWLQPREVIRQGASRSSPARPPLAVR
ncbi:recombinase family protein [Streptomyces sp. 840.1]|uniref:recombinase family protein n=1 Tax=Streptomyces sp. 840.1 TaxID=2485152 RepID=UPI0021A71CB0|nr:recombinase family protein [Streptomyces sp. 840.1]